MIPNDVRKEILLSIQKFFNDNEYWCEKSDADGTVNVEAMENAIQFMYSALLKAYRKELEPDRFSTLLGNACTSFFHRTKRIAFIGMTRINELRGVIKAAQKCTLSNSFRRHGRNFWAVLHQIICQRNNSSQSFVINRVSAHRTSPSKMSVETAGDDCDSSLPTHSNEQSKKTRKVYVQNFSTDEILAELNERADLGCLTLSHFTDDELQQALKERGRKK